MGLNGWCKNKMSLQEMNDLSSVIYSLNRGTNWKSQHNGANYLSTRDETHSDIAGLFLMTYLAMKMVNTMIHNLTICLETLEKCVLLTI